MSSDPIFIIEVCQNCAQHQWNTRHNEEKYNNYFKMMATAIVEKIPNAVVMRNQIPKDFMNYDCYINLVPNEDPNIPYFQQIPRIGAFEVSHNGLVIFSKFMSHQWPNWTSVAEKCQLVFENLKLGRDTSQFLAGMGRQPDGSYGPISR